MIYYQNYSDQHRKPAASRIHVIMETAWQCGPYYPAGLEFEAGSSNHRHHAAHFERRFVQGISVCVCVALNPIH